MDTFQPPWVHGSGVWDCDLAARAGAGGCRRSRCIQIVREPIQLMSVSDIQDHFRAGGRVFGNSPLYCRFSIPASSSASHSLAAGHSSFALAPPAGSGRAQTLPRWLLPSTDRRIAKNERGPISTSGASIFSMSLKFSMLPNQEIPSDKSIPFSPLAAARPLTKRLWPEALDARGSKRACRMATYRNARTFSSVHPPTS